MIQSSAFCGSVHSSHLCDHIRRRLALVKSTGRRTTRAKWSAYTAYDSVQSINSASGRLIFALIKLIIKSHPCSVPLSLEACPIDLHEYFASAPDHESQFYIDCNRCVCFAGEVVCTHRQCLAHSPSTMERDQYTGRC